MKPNKLAVAEVFFSIQGEGPTTGCPSVFLRLAGCNLFCNGKWRCDTIEVWQKGKSLDFDMILTDNQIDYLKQGAHLVVTGGEPLLQQAALVEYFIYLQDEYNFYPYIEVETNGTIVPVPLFIHFVDQFNVSPKLNNSGETYEKRVNEQAIRRLIDTKMAWFKFVINQHSDWIDITDEYPFVPHDRIVLMPAGDTQDELNRRRLEVIELCKATGARYSDRLHIVAWNKKTGV